MAKMLELGGLENHMEMRQELCFPEALLKVYMEHSTPLEIYFKTLLWCLNVPYNYIML